MNSTTRDYFFKGFINSDTFDYCLHEWKTYKLFHTDDEEVRKIDISVANVVSVSALVCYCTKVGARANTKKKKLEEDRRRGEKRKRLPTNLRILKSALADVDRSFCMAR